MCHQMIQTTSILIKYTLPLGTKTSDVRRNTQSQIIRHNYYFHNLAIIPLFNLGTDIIYSDTIHKAKLISSIKWFEEIRLIYSKGKWILLIVTNIKQNA